MLVDIGIQYSYSRITSSAAAEQKSREHGFQYSALLSWPVWNLQCLMILSCIDFIFFFWNLFRKVKEFAWMFVIDTFSASSLNHECTHCSGTDSLSVYPLLGLSALDFTSPDRSLRCSRSHTISHNFSIWEPRISSISDSLEHMVQVFYVLDCFYSSPKLYWPMAPEDTASWTLIICV